MIRREAGMKQFAVAAAILVMSGCAVPTMSEAYGPSPEMTFPADKAALVKGQIVGAMVKDGYTIIHSDDYSLVLTGPLEGIGNSLAYGTRLAGQPGVKITFAIIPTGKGEITWRANAVAISNPGSGFERQNSLNDRNPIFSEIHGYMSQVKSQILRGLL